jgi:hypothetical protein
MPSAIQISRDDAALVGNAGRWRDAMGRMGKGGVEVELRRRPGRPTDPVLDIGYEAPYPTREFCQQWCAEQDNILFRFSPRMGIILILLAVVIICVLQAVSGIGNAPVGPMSGVPPMPMATAAPPQITAAPGGFQSVPPYQPGTASQSTQSSSQLPSLPSLPSLLSVPTMQQNAPTGGSTSP